MLKRIEVLFKKVRNVNPLVHHITNSVTINDCANITLAIGGSPVMASSVNEAADMAKIAHALVINLGTLNADSCEAMILAGKAANSANIPVILDPVGAGATAYRIEMAEKILQEVKMSIIRGNASEIYSLIGGQSQTKGVDSGMVSLSGADLAVKAAVELNSTIVVSGRTDAISNGETTVIVNNGDPLLTKVTGTGCMATSLIGSFAGVTDQMLDAAVAGISVMSIAGELTKSKLLEGEGTGTFRVKLVDTISLMNGEIWMKEVQINEYATR
ncbi:hydroxyethylthiazole kinase [Peribacillus huizhouensis]|uniref:Hydroxyethylthiazole kinase n=1 Tax=Peribacillus huizhouensis TaxID=1501239 RepID=A0ABR6CLX8_9BACI|nr:hydroxyethylthiazole kinase [Peribacillus huizhouensis]MBA9026041.1 hydroxyethylthiazole kinase [Peribacillus huizhouensis]